MHIHLDIVGGIAGDMFCSAMLDAFPEQEKPLRDFLSSLTIFQKYTLSITQKKQKDIIGKQFAVLKNSQPIVDSNHLVLTPLNQIKHQAVKTRKAFIDNHEHYSWQEILQKLKQIEQYHEIYQSAKEIYTILAKAESEIHGIELKNIGLHEVGADDAIIDIISAAFLIHKSQVTSWSCSTLPWGKGTIKCAHGELPVPAPATLKILTNFEWEHDDEIGERITPTGAAILAWIMQHHSGNLAGKFVKSGYGCGNRVFKQKPNIIRINVFNLNHVINPIELYTNLETDIVYIIQCDIDDMTPELLAIAQDKLRNTPSLIDLTSYNIMGKKGRWVTRIEILCRKQNLDEICKKILEQTSTLGVRYWETQRTKVIREQITINDNNQIWSVKLAHRPNEQITAKLEADIVAKLDVCHDKRKKIKNKIEQIAIDEYMLAKKDE